MSLRLSFFAFTILFASSTPIGQALAESYEFEDGSSSSIDGYSSTYGLYDTRFEDEHSVYYGWVIDGAVRWDINGDNEPELFADQRPTQVGSLYGAGWEVSYDVSTVPPTKQTIRTGVVGYFDGGWAIEEERYRSVKYLWSELLQEWRYSELESQETVTRTKETGTGVIRHSSGYSRTTDYFSYDDGLDKPWTDRSTDSFSKIISYNLDAKNNYKKRVEFKANIGSHRLDGGYKRVTEFSEDGQISSFRLSDPVGFSGSIMELEGHYSDVVSNFKWDRRDISSGLTVENLDQLTTLGMIISAYFEDMLYLDTSDLSEFPNWWHSLEGDSSSDYYEEDSSSVSESEESSDSSHCEEWHY